MIIFTEQYLATAPRALVAVTFPDGATMTAEPIADGNGVLVGRIRAAIASWGNGHTSQLAENSRSLDALRKSHADAFAKNPARTSSAWAVAP